MARERMCAYASCQETKVAVTVNTGDERPAFCCAEHAGLWLLRQSFIHELGMQGSQKIVDAIARDYLAH